MKINILQLDERAQMPTRGSEGAACFDLKCLEGGAVFSHRSQVFRTGLAFEIPEGFVMLVYSRSGHGFKYGVRLSNCVGVIDSDYRGEVLVKLQNDSKHTYEVEAGERVAQAMIVPVPVVEFDIVEQLSITDRGVGGLGSTGRV